MGEDLEAEKISPLRPRQINFNLNFLTQTPPPVRSNYLKKIPLYCSHSLLLVGLQLQMRPDKKGQSRMTTSTI